MGKKIGFVDLIIKDLYRYGIMNTESVRGLGTPDGMFVGRLTDYGNKFLKYMQYN